jgi:hypothetical protein
MIYQPQGLLVESHDDDSITYEDRTWIIATSPQCKDFEVGGDLPMVGFLLNEALVVASTHNADSCP